MRSLDPAVTALMVSGRWIQREAILFDFAEGQYGFWWGQGPFTWNGVTFVGAGQLLDVQDVSAGGDMPPELTVTLSAVPNSDLTPDVLATVEEYTWHLRPALVYRFFFSPETGAMVGSLPDVLFRGQVDQIRHLEGESYTLEARLVGRTVDLRKAGRFIRGIETQKVINGGEPDLFFEHAASSATQTAKWGTGE
ncbi:MAG: hypothetical protein CMN87_12080 [Stappia sp.]|uniref:hypothetical protein n=1 Tax=Stappia sp. TaxID=1870903 RepID=UPI000C5C8F5F|nr:hypothetical protein [Stappia sp.]MAB00100.1 hypothetical protein [Stappia sp.]MBM20739.1 hypothetical protein [Stappia sp.]